MLTSNCSERDAFGHWLSGFTDGEGCFRLAVDKARRNAIATWQITIRHDDRPILEEIKAYLGGCGDLYYRECGSNQIGKPLSTLLVARTRECAEIIVPHFEKYPLRAKKAKDFALWKEAIALRYVVYQRKRKRTNYKLGFLNKWLPGEYERFCEIADAMKEQRRYESGTIIIPPPKTIRERGLFDGQDSA